MRIPLSKSEVAWYAECYEGLPPTETKRFATALEADNHLCRRLRRAARRGHLTLLDLEEVARWKFPAPALLHKVRENSARRVEQITAISFAAQNDEKQRVETLLELRGVWWPMGSTILHFVFDNRYPIVDVRAMRVIGGPDYFNFPRWSRYVELCRETAAEYGVTLRQLDRALWTLDYLRSTLGASAALHRLMQIGTVPQRTEPVCDTVRARRKQR